MAIPDLYTEPVEREGFTGQLVMGQLKITRHNN